MSSSKLTKGLSGVAGEFFVAAELSGRGYIATVTLRNTAGIDILATSADGSRFANIQVKTNQGSSARWVLTKKAESLVSDNLFTSSLVSMVLNYPHIIWSRAKRWQSVVSRIIEIGSKGLVQPE